MVSEVVSKLKDEIVSIKRQVDRNTITAEDMSHMQTEAQLLIGVAICEAIENAAEAICSSIDHR